MPKPRAKPLGGGGGHWLVLNFSVIWLCLCVVVGEQLPKVRSPQGLMAVLRLVPQMLSLLSHLTGLCVFCCWGLHLFVLLLETGCHSVAHTGWKLPI